LGVKSSNLKCTIVYYHVRFDHTKPNLAKQNQHVLLYIIVVVLYASETRTMTQADRKRLEAMEMWIWRRMEKISWMDKISNEEVLQRVSETKTILDTAGQRQRVARA